MPRSRTRKKKSGKTWIDVDIFGECRLFTGHRWNKTRAYGFDQGLVFMQHRCQCAATRNTWYKPFTGEIKSRYIDYPDGYLLDLQGKKRPSQASLRVEYFKKYVRRKK